MFSWLAFAWAFTFGYNPARTFSMTYYQKPVVEIQKNSFFEGFELNAIAFDHLQVSGSMTCWEQYAGFMYGTPDFKPWQIESKIGCKYFVFNYKKDCNIIFVVEHQCTHPITPIQENLSVVNSGDTSISVTLKGQF